MTYTGKAGIKKPTGVITVVRGGRRRRIYAPSRHRARDVRILQGLADGMRYKSLSEQEGVSVEYVKQIMMRLRKEFDVETNEHLIAQAIREGAIS